MGGDALSQIAVGFLVVLELEKGLPVVFEGFLVIRLDGDGLFEKGEGFLIGLAQILQLTQGGVDLEPVGILFPSPGGSPLGPQFRPLCGDDLSEEAGA